MTWGFLGACIGGVGVSGLLHYATTPGANVGTGFVVGLAIFALATVLAFFCRDRPAQSLRQWLGVWVFAGTRNLRSTFQVRCVLCCCTLAPTATSAAPSRRAGAPSGT